MGNRHSSLVWGLPLLCWLACCTSVTDDGKTWSQPERLDDDQGTVYPSVSLGPAGAATVLHEELTGLLYSTRHTQGTGWVRESIGIGGSQELASNPDGNLVAVWRQGFWDPSDPGYVPPSIWSNRYTVGGGWEMAVRLHPEEEEHGAANPHVAMDPDGNAIAVWHQSDGTRENIWANRSTPGVGWGSAELIEMNNRGQAGDPRVAMDADGNAIAVWHQKPDDKLPADIWANRYRSGQGWGTPEQIDADGQGEARLPDVAMDPEGNATVVWQQSDGVRSVVWSNRFTRSSRWGAPTRIDADDLGDAKNARIGADAEGHAIAVWQQFGGIATDIWSNRYTPDAGWGTPERIETTDDGDAFSPRVAVNVRGDAVAVWLQSDGSRYDVWSNAYTAGPGWSTAVRVDPTRQGVGSPVRAEVAINAESNAMAAWWVRDDIVFDKGQIWAARYE